MFAISVIIYWSLAFTISSSVPQFSNVSSLVASVCVFRESLFALSFYSVVDVPKKEFSYTFPPFMILGYVMQRTALSGDKPYNVNNPHDSRVDSWRDWSRWTRACMSVILSMLSSWLIAGLLCKVSKYTMFNLWNFIIAIACMTGAVLASYASIKSIITAFHDGHSTSSFSCRSPVQ